MLSCKAYIWLPSVLVLFLAMFASWRPYDPSSQAELQPQSALKISLLQTKKVVAKQHQGHFHSRPSLETSAKEMFGASADSNKAGWEETIVKKLDLEDKFVLLGIGGSCILTKIGTGINNRVPKFYAYGKRNNRCYADCCKEKCKNNPECTGFSITRKKQCRIYFEGPLMVDHRKKNMSNLDQMQLCVARDFRGPYKLYPFMQCDAQSLDSKKYLGFAHAKKACYQDETCDGLYNLGCQGEKDHHLSDEPQVGGRRRGNAYQGSNVFRKCKQKFTMIPSGRDELSRGCVFAKAAWAPVSYVKNSTGCQCYFDENRTDCACCHHGACQCSQSIGADRCAPCDAMYKCIVSEDLNDFPDLTQVVSSKMLMILNDILEASTYEAKQSGIRAFLKEAYELPTSKAKVEAVALLDAKLNKGKSKSTSYEFPDAQQVEAWLDSWFLKDEFYQLYSNKSSSVPIDASGNKEEKRVIKGLQSRGALIQEKLNSCNWQQALKAFFDSGGAYGNWCGKMPPGSKTFKSSGACKSGKNKVSKWGFSVCDDSGFDESCARHDQGAYVTDAFGIATQSLCKVDADFKAARQRLNPESGFQDELERQEAGAITGANCLFDMMPCWRYERQEVWDWCPSWSGGYPCLKSLVGYHTHWPFGDYSKFKDDACGPTGCYWEDDVIAQ
eukprot:gnl/MRDRNA2_/MRDRNA2_89713_c0_seq1.p1 gnl/MRDRNA2_/MRDRNA2_89713_c0~~gnl/MRDRNA2_/MRDRNA2_89713_c0_seq1.p1  ORF type:complete len:669 (-),score=86.57 gnl/MRDRNA2_/MRDRNA2_89713_c0_seq1:19-2025(-)